ncbi:MAG TPA: carbon-nitrogen hydrolase family protein, partial [Pyrinomonadaceae bacterium]
MSQHSPATLNVACVQMHWAKTIEYNIKRTEQYIQAAAESGARVALFPEASLTSYYFPYVVELEPKLIEDALERTRAAAAAASIWAIVGTIKKTHDRFLNLMHVIDPKGALVHEYAT